MWTIGRHCLLAAQIGLAGSLTIGDNVVLGAGIGIDSHLRIGDGAQVTAMSAVRTTFQPTDAGWSVRRVAARRIQRAKAEVMEEAAVRLRWWISMRSSRRCRIVFRCC